MGSIEDTKRSLRDRIEAKCWECRAQDEGYRDEETGKRWHKTAHGDVECAASALRDELDAITEPAR